MDLRGWRMSVEDTLVKTELEYTLVRSILKEQSGEYRTQMGGRWENTLVKCFARFSS